MEQGSPQNSTSSSSLEQSKLTPTMAEFLSPHQSEKRPRVIEVDDEDEEDEQTTSYLALLTGGESPRPPIFPTLGEFGFNNVPPTPIRPMAIQISTRNAPYFERPTLRRKLVGEDATPPNPIAIWEFSDQVRGRNNLRNYGGVGRGYSVYDEKYRAIGLPVDPHLRMFNQIYGKGNAGF